MVSANVKLVSSVIGGVLYNFGLGTVFPLGNFAIYIVSYHMHDDKSISTNFSFFLLPILTFALTCFGWVGGIVESKVGCKM